MDRLGASLHWVVSFGCLSDRKEKGELMKTDNSSKGNVKYGARIIAVFLVAGGLLGILSLVMMHFHLAPSIKACP